jgi:nucleoside-diphosphate-sugar epimerase
MPENPNFEFKKTSLAPSSVIFFGGNYLGSKLAEKLLEKESRVIVVDKFDSQKESYYINLRDNPKLLLISCDLEKDIPREIASSDYVYFLNYQDYYNPVDKFKIVETTQITKNIFNFSNNSKSKIVLVSNIDISNKFYKKSLDTQLLIEEIFKESDEDNKLNIRFVRLPIIYGPRMSFENSGGLIKMLDSYLNKDKVTLDEDNNHKNYFIYIDDAIEAIIRAIFSEKTYKENIVVSESEAYSDLEVGSILKSISPRAIDTQLSENNDPIIWRIPEDRNLHLIGFAPKTSLRNGLIKTLSYFGHETNTYSFKPEKVAKENMKNALTKLKADDSQVEEKSLNKPKNPEINYAKIKKTTYSSNWLPKNKKEYLLSFGTVFLSFFLIFFALPLGILYGNLNDLRNNFNEVRNNLEKGRLKEAIEGTKKLDGSISSTYENFNRFKFLITIFETNENFEDYNKVLISLKNFNQGLGQFSEGAIPYLEISKALKDGSEVDINELTKSINPFTESLQNFIKANDLVKDSNAKFDQVKMYQETLPKLIKTNEILLAVSRDAKDLLGFEEPKKILVLFQNPYEVRPTGGFIGSYGVVEISKGKVISVRIDDIYNPDGQIDVKKVNIAPPQYISYFLKENKLYIRNSNYNSDFPTSARLINDLFDKAIQEKFQTVIAIDTKFIEKFLQTFGDVYLNNYEETITASNFVERAQFHSEVNYQPGVSEKKSFLTSLGSKILERLLSSSPEQIAPFANNIYNLLETKNFQIYTELPYLSRSLSNLEWDGSLVPTQGDYLKIVNSNYGGNKVNYLTKNEYSYTVKSMTRDGILRGEVVLVYKNNSKDKAWPYGDYVNYIKIVTPVGAKLTGARVVNSKGDEINLINNILLSSEGIYQTFETSLTIAPDSSQKLIIEYDLPNNLNIIKNKNTTYSLVWQKQAGDESAFKYKFEPLYGFDISGIESSYIYGESEGDYVINSNFSGNLRFRANLK